MRQRQRHHDRDAKTIANSTRTKNHGPLPIVIMIKDTKTKTLGPWTVVLHDLDLGWR